MKKLILIAVLFSATNAFATSTVVLNSELSDCQKTTLVNETVPLLEEIDQQSDVNTTMAPDSVFGYAVANDVEIQADDLKQRSLYVGFSPFGGTSITLSPKNGNAQLKYKFNSYWNCNILYENKAGKYGYTILGLSFGHAKLDKIEIAEGAESLIDAVHMRDLKQGDGLTTLSANINYGLMSGKKRFQIAVFPGIGIDYLKGSSFNNVAFYLGGLARLKFYFTNDIGMYVGGNARWGWGSRKIDEENYKLNVKTMYLDAGMVFSF